MAAAATISFGQAVYSGFEGDWGAAAWHAADAIMAGVGLSGGPVGLGVSLVYFVGRHLTSC